MTWDELTQEVSLRVFRIECADMLIQPADAEERWKAMSRLGSSPRAQIERTVGSALIALKEMGLVEYE